MLIKSRELEVAHDGSNYDLVHIYAVSLLLWQSNFSLHFRFFYSKATFPAIGVFLIPLSSSYTYFYLQFYQLFVWNKLELSQTLQGSIARPNLRSGGSCAN